MNELVRELIAFRDAGLWDDYKPGNISAICSAVEKWSQSRNPFFMDFALELTFATGAPITETLKKQILEAATFRREGKAKGTYKQVERHVYQETAFRIICCLRFIDEPIEDAAAKAAHWLDSQTNGRFTYKASSLEKMYENEYVKTGRQQELHAEYSASDSDPSSWLNAASQMPTFTNEVMRGTRR